MLSLLFGVVAAVWCCRCCLVLSLLFGVVAAVCGCCLMLSLLFVVVFGSFVVLVVV